MPVSVFAGAESSSIPKTVAQQRSFSQPQVFRGQLGGKLIEMHLQPKKEEPESLEGYYLIGPDWKKKYYLPVNGRDRKSVSKSQKMVRTFRVRWRRNGWKKVCQETGCRQMKH
jgi:hypothetical protein